MKDTAAKESKCITAIHTHHGLAQTAARLRVLKNVTLKDH